MSSKPYLVPDDRAEQLAEEKAINEPMRGSFGEESRETATQIFAQVGTPASPFSCGMCRDTGYHQVFVNNRWHVRSVTTGVDSHGEPIYRLSRCDHHTEHGEPQQPVMPHQTAEIRQFPRKVESERTEEPDEEDFMY